MEIKKVLAKPENLKEPFKDASQLDFGRNFTDHMFCMEYLPGKEWTNAEIKPYQPLVLDPATMVLHYSQAVFEGQKAYLSPDGEILLFRPDENAKRINRSLVRMGMPTIPENIYLQAECELLKIEKRWIPKQRGTSLYIRPVVLATERFLGAIVPSDRYLFYIILSPVGFFYKEGFNPVKLIAE